MYLSKHFFEIIKDYVEYTNTLINIIIYMYIYMIIKALIIIIII